MPKIVISYRRQDSEVFSGRIYDRLVQQYGKDSVFIDIDKIPYGEDFAEAISRQLDNADVLLVVIGPNWLGVGSDGQSRILHEQDWVRVELETAISLKVRVIPLLINQATMPTPAALPASLKDFPKINALSVDGGADFHPHMVRLIGAIDRFLKERGQQTGKSRTPLWAQRNVVAAAAAGSFLVVLLVVGIANETVRARIASWFSNSPPEVVSLPAGTKPAVQANAPAPPLDETADEKAIILNVVKASLRRPMGISPLPSSGAPNTSQFQAGIRQPLSTQEIDYFLRSGFASQLAFDLFVQQIQLVAVDSPTCDKFTFVNSVQNELQFAQFQAFADYILSSGLTTERITEAGNVRFRSCFAKDGSLEPTWLGVRENDVYCGSTQPTRAALKPTKATAGACGSPVTEGIKLSELLLVRLQNLQDGVDIYREQRFPVERFRNRRVTFQFHTRSVEGILYYLGEIVRLQRYPESSGPRTVQFKVPFVTGLFPMSECEPSGVNAVREQKQDLRRLAQPSVDDRHTYSCENLFVLDGGPVPGAYVTVNYDGQSYSIPNDRARAGRTTQVLEMLKTMLLLHVPSK